MELRKMTLGELVAEAGGDIQTGPFGSQLHASDYVSNGMPTVMPQNIGDNRIEPAGIARVSDSDMKRLRRYWLRDGDIVYSRRGDVEKRALVRPENDGWLCGTGCLRVRILNLGAHDSSFVSYALGDPAVRSWITQHAVGATMLNLNTSILSAVPLSVPPIDQQRAIAEVLGALDDKIAANDQLVATSDNIMALRFIEASAADSHEVPLSSIARFVNGKAFTKNATGTGRVVIRIAELNSGLGGSTVYNDLEVADDHLAQPGDVLFAWSGSLTVKRWSRPEGIINQHIFKVIPTAVPIWLVKVALDSTLTDFRSIAADKATTMGHIQRRHLDRPVRIPGITAIRRLDSLMTPLWTRALAGERESLHLAALRDTLLPALMSGRLTVKSAEATVSEVV